jgi:hypothetical protein
MTRRAWLIGFAAAQALQAQSPAASYPVVEFDGTIAQVLAVGQQGNPPSLEVKTHDGKSVRVVLGSVRYLIEHNFNPKAGTLVHVNGFKTEEEVIAREVTLVRQKRTLRLRDEDGWPLWRFGRHRGQSRTQ